MRRTVMLGLVSILVGCKGVEPAPADIDGLAHYFWDGFDAPEDEVIASGVLSLHDALDADTLEDPFDGTISDLNQAQLEAVGLGDMDASEPAGIFMANIINCSLESVEASAYAINQDELHPGLYESYDREYTTDFEAYRSRQANRLSWVTAYEVSGFGAKYAATIDVSMRYVPTLDGELDGEELSPYGPVVVSRAALREPAYFENSDKQRGLMQDYQLEVFYARAPKETVHFYVIWRDMQYTDAVDFDGEGTQRLVLNGLVDWDEEIEAACGAN